MLINMFALKEYRVIRPLFCRLLCVPATSAPVERRVFCTGGRGLIIRPNRAKIGDDLLETIMYLRCSGN